MSTVDPKCPQCRVPMERGFLLDRNHDHRGGAANWVEGEPEKSFWTGLDLKGRAMRTITSFRCPNCGLLLDFASGPESTGS
jgi:hypothetical protein